MNKKLKKRKIKTAKRSIGQGRLVNACMHTTMRTKPCDWIGTMGQPFQAKNNSWTE